MAFKPQIPTVPDVVLWRAESCARADRALSLLAQAKAETQTLIVAQTPPSADQMKELAAQYDGPARDLALHREPLFKELALEDADENTLLAALAQHPSLLRLPIGVARGKAVIARPADLILALLAPELPEGTDTREMVRLGMSGKTPDVDTSDLPIQPKGYAPPSE